MVVDAVLFRDQSRLAHRRCLRIGVRRAERLPPPARELSNANRDNPNVLAYLTD